MIPFIKLLAAETHPVNGIGRSRPSVSRAAPCGGWFLLLTGKPRAAAYALVVKWSSLGYAAVLSHDSTGSTRFACLTVRFQSLELDRPPQGGYVNKTSA